MLKFAHVQHTANANLFHDKEGIFYLSWDNKKIGFNSDFNEVSIFYKNKKFDKLKFKPKSEISDEIVDKIINHLN